MQCSGEERKSLVTALGETMHVKLHDALVAAVNELTPIIIAKVKEEIAPVEKDILTKVIEPLRNNATLILGVLALLILVPWLAAFKYLL